MIYIIIKYKLLFRGIVSSGLKKGKKDFGLYPFIILAEAA
jgi:hypothetical protein